MISSSRKSIIRIAMGMMAAATLWGLAPTASGQEGVLQLDKVWLMDEFQGTYVQGNGEAVMFSVSVRRDQNQPLAEAIFKNEDGSTLLVSRAANGIEQMKIAGQVLDPEKFLEVRAREALRELGNGASAEAFAMIPLEVSCGVHAQLSFDQRENQTLAIAALSLPWRMMLRDGQSLGGSPAWVDLSSCDRYKVTPLRRLSKDPSQHHGSLEIPQPTPHLKLLECEIFGYCENSGNGYSNDCFGCCGKGCDWSVGGYCDTSEACLDHDTCYYFHGSGNFYCDLRCAVNYGVGPCLDGLYGMGTDSVGLDTGGTMNNPGGCFSRGRWCDQGWCDCGGSGGLF